MDISRSLIKLPGQVLFSQYFAETSGYQQLDIDTGELDLLAGATDLAYVDPASPGVANIDDHFDSIAGTDYADGYLLWFQNNAGWFVDGNADLAFRATFVPEPHFGLLLATLLPFLRRDRRNEKHPSSCRRGFPGWGAFSRRVLLANCAGLP